MSDFSDYKKYFKEYQKRFGLTGYKVYFEYKELDGAFGSIAIKHYDMVATIKLNSKPTSKDREIKATAKHEAIHLLLGKLEYLANKRFTSGDEIYEAGEELAVKLEGLIRD